MKKNTKTTTAKRSATSTRTTLHPVVVTTANRGVFFGYVDSIKTADTIRLTRARNCIFWHRSIGGFMGLASVGPNTECRIGARVPAITLTGITAVIECSPESTTAWEAAPCVK